MSAQTQRDGSRQEAVRSHSAYFFLGNLARIEHAVVVGAENHDVIDLIATTMLAGNNVRNVVRRVGPATIGANVTELLSSHHSEGVRTRVSLYVSSAINHFAVPLSLAFNRARNTMLGFSFLGGKVSNLLTTDDTGGFLFRSYIRRMNFLVGKTARLITKFRGSKFMGPFSNNNITALHAAFPGHDMPIVKLYCREV